MNGRPERAGVASDRFFGHWGLIAVTCAISMAEAGILVAYAPAARALAPQLTALAPLAIFHDLRWLYTAQPSVAYFGLLLTGLVAIRAGLTTVFVRLAWPAARRPPGLLTAFREALPVTAVACVLMSPIVSLSFGVAILPFSWPFLAMLPAMLLIALPLGYVGVVGTWWRELPPLPVAGWLLTEFVVLSAAAAACGALPPLAAVPMAGVAGLVNARAWYGVTACATRPKAARENVTDAPLWRVMNPLWLLREIPGVPLAIAIVISLVIVMTRLVFILGGHGYLLRPAGALGNPAVAAAQPGPQASPASAPAAGPRDPVLEIFGFGSTCCPSHPALASAMPGTLVRQFSYLGTSRSGTPLPYQPTDSNLPLPLIGDRIAAQVWRLHERTGQRVDLVAESEGTLGVDAMLARHPHAPIGSVVLLSPIVNPGAAGYRNAAEAGVVARDELHAVIWFVGGLSPFGSSGAQRLIDSVSDDGARFAAAARQSPRRLLELVPLADAVTLPACRLPANVLVLPAFHGELLGDPAALRMVRAFLYHQPVRGAPALRDTAEFMAAAATAWRMPQPTEPTPPCQR
jgi:hypothetical protein